MINEHREREKVSADVKIEKGRVSVSRVYAVIMCFGSRRSRQKSFAESVHKRSRRWGWRQTNNATLLGRYRRWGDTDRKRVGENNKRLLLIFFFCNDETKCFLCHQALRFKRFKKHRETHL